MSVVTWNCPYVHIVYPPWCTSSTCCVWGVGAGSISISLSLSRLSIFHSPSLVLSIFSSLPFSLSSYLHPPLTPISLTVYLFLSFLCLHSYFLFSLLPSLPAYLRMFPSLSPYLSPSPPRLSVYSLPPCRPTDIYFYTWWSFASFLLFLDVSVYASCLPTSVWRMLTRK